MQTAREFAATNTEFKNACSRVRAHSAKHKVIVALEPSARQARKWRQGKGLAWKKGRPR